MTRGRATPRVSVLMSTRDGAHLRPAVETLLAQTMTDFELVLVDDASDPDARALIDALAAQDARIVVRRRPRSHGLAAALNDGLALCRAPLVARADADDEYHPDRLGRQAAVMDERPSLGVLSCGWDWIDEAGRVTRRVTPVTGSDRLAFRHLFASQLLHPGVVFRTPIVRAAGGYDPAYWTAQDTELWGRLLGVTRIDNVPDRLVRWRRHGGSISASRGRRGRHLSASLPQRYLSDYVGARIPAGPAFAAARTWRGEPVPLAHMRVGLRVLRRVRAAAARRSEPHMRRDLVLKVARSLSEQAAKRAPRAPGEAARIAALVAQWSMEGDAS